MNTPEIPFNLQTAIKNNKIIVFIGAGLSKSLGLPSWKEIVLKTLENSAIEKRQAYLSALDSGIMGPLEVLDKMEQEYKKEIYGTFEKETSKKITSEIYNKICKISQKLITTNYDRLIEQNCNIPVISTNSAYSLNKIDENSSFLLKIHGDCNEIDNAIVFSKNYIQLYESPDGLAKFQLEKLISSHTCLFIGFSMADNYVSAMFDRLCKMYKGTGRDHFAISTNPIEHPSVKTIKIDSYEYLPELLDSLINIKETSLVEDHESTVVYSDASSNSSIVHSEYDGIPIKIGNDTPPITDHWTGRSEELESLMGPHKVCFITGIGGQGKSALASKLLSESSQKSFDFIDWRDFKEEDLNFQSKLYPLIEIVSHKSLTTANLIGLDTETLVNIFFEKLEKQKGFFVFDNIDKYIDLEKFTPTGDIAYFFQKALKTQHHSKFIFTCRPFIHHAGIGFYQVQLEGLQFDDVKELIKKYHPQINANDLNHYATGLHSATQGHPLWMALILAQSRNSLKEIDNILKKISAHHDSTANINISAIISRTILEDVWNKLKDREKVILRTLSISSIAEKEEDLAKIVERKLNYNQFSKAMKSLQSFNIIVKKEGDGYIELHPLVREFIKFNYAREQQENYIALYVNYLDGFICLIKDKLGRVLTPDDISLVIKKIEILINSEKLSEAANELRVTGDSFRISGYSEEFIRLCDSLFSKNIWTNKKISAITGFNDLIFNFLETTANFGDHSLFDKHLNNFLSVFSAADKNMILVKSAMCYREWCRGDYSQAIIAGKSAVDLIDIFGDNDIWEGRHHYNLALRDTKDPQNVLSAMNYFCNGKDLEHYLLDEPSNDESASTYGNIGRCLLCLNEEEKALLLICKSYKIFNTKPVSLFNKNNIGYAGKWIYEILTKKNDFKTAFYFLLYARNVWKNDVPEEANRLERQMATIPQSTVLQSIASLESWQIVKFCDNWVDSYLKANLPTETQNYQ